jgi:tetratricopeptide (TPR) repeat protein
MISRPQLATIPLIIGLLICQYKLHNQERAEGNLRDFYSSIVEGDLTAAQTQISQATRLSPSDARYAAWAAYLDGQTVPSDASCSHEGEPLTAAQHDAAERAIMGYQKASQLNPADAQFHHNMAWLYHRLGDDKSAIVEHERAITLDQPNSLLHASFGLLLETRGQVERADREYARALALSPQLIDSRFFEDFKQRSPERSRNVLKAATLSLDQSAGPIVKAKLGRIYAALDDKKRASLLITNALQQLPNLPLAWANLGSLQSEDGDLEGALSSYTKAVALDPSLVMPYLRMADIYRTKRESQQALRDYQLAARNADAKLPPSASHDSRLYRGSRQSIDSQLPTVLFRYMSSCDGSQAYLALAELSPRRRDAAYFRTRASDCQIIQSPYRFCSASGRIAKNSSP